MSAIETLLSRLEQKITLPVIGQSAELVSLKVNLHNQLVIILG